MKYLRFLIKSELNYPLSSHRIWKNYEGHLFSIEEATAPPPGATGEQPPLLPPLSTTLPYTSMDAAGNVGNVVSYGERSQFYLATDKSALFASNSKLCKVVFGRWGRFQSLFDISTYNAIFDEHLHTETADRAEITLRSRGR